MNEASGRLRALEIAESPSILWGRRVDKRSASTASRPWWMRCAYPPYNAMGSFVIFDALSIVSLVSIANRITNVITLEFGMFVLKLTQIGNSVGVILPRELLGILHVESNQA